MHFMFFLVWLQGTYLVSLTHGPQTGRTILQLWLLLNQAALVATSQKTRVSSITFRKHVNITYLSYSNWPSGFQRRKIIPLINAMTNIYQIA